MTTLEYDKLQKVRQELTNISVKLSECNKCKNEETKKLAKEIEIEVDNLRRKIFNYNEK